jgi:aquaporin Z
VLTFRGSLLKISRSPSRPSLTAHLKGGSHGDATTVRMACSSRARVARVGCPGRGWRHTTHRRRNRGGVVDAVSHGAIGRGASVTAPGLMVLAIILFMGAVSGAHLNPAVTLGFALRGDFPWRRVPGYIVAELLGSTLAVLLLWAMFGKVGSLGATEPGAGISDVQAMLMELILTVGLFSVILGTASKAQNLGPLSALGVGAYIVLAGLWSSPISGASMNPARSFGPDLVLGNFAHYWVYVVGPILGAAIAVGFAFILRGRADTGGAAAAQGALGTLRVGPDEGGAGTSS